MAKGGYGLLVWDVAESDEIDVRDIAEFAARVLTDDTGRHDGAVYTPTGPESLTLTEVTARFSQILDRTVDYRADSDENQRQILRSYGIPPWIVDMLIEYSQAYATGWGDFTTGHFRDVVGHEPRHVDDFIRDHSTAFS